MVLEIAHMPAGMDDARSRKQNVEAKDRDAKRKPAGSKKADLMDVRVIQRHLVYAVGLAADICTDQVLKGSEYFGKYGKIKKISVTWNNNSCSARQASAAAYVLYHSEEEAWNCIQSIDGAMWGGKQVRACYGTTKYCHSYLRKATCSNPECSYLHEPAPEEDTVTKDEMNPITGRKDILHLVHPGGTPRSRAKKALARPTSQPIGATPAPVPEPSPSKDSPAWAIPAPDGTDAVGKDMLEAVRDSSSPSDSPQFVIAANAAPNAWPALSELATNTDTFCDQASLAACSRRPSTKAVVTGDATVADTPSKEVTQGARMLPLAAPGRSRYGIRGVVVNGSAPLLSSSSHELQEDEHALSTMPSAELLGSRARLDLCADSPGGSPLAPPHSPSAMMPPPDAASVFSAPPEAAQAIGTAANTSAAGPHGLQAQLHLNTAAAAAYAASAEAHTGEQVLSALDLLPASLEDALDGRASLPTTAPAEAPHSPHKAASYPATPAPQRNAESTHAGVVHPSARKQSRFAFVNNDGAACAASVTSSSLPKDLDHLMDAPAFRPGSARMPGMHMEAPDMSSHTRHTAGMHAWDHAPTEEHVHTVKQFSLPLDASMGAAAAQHILQQQQQHQQQQQARLNPAAPSGLEQPPMTHESVVQAVSAQLQQIMSQGGHTAATPAASRMMAASGAADGGIGGLDATSGGRPTPWPHMQQQQQQVPQKAVPDQGRPEQMQNSGIQFLQALLEQQQQRQRQQQQHEMSAGHNHAVPAGISEAMHAMQQHPGAHQGLPIKRPPQPPKPMASMASGVGGNMYQYPMVPHPFMPPQRGGSHALHEGAHSLPHALHHVGAAHAALHHTGVGGGGVPPMQRGMPFGQQAARMDAAAARARTLQQHHMSQYGDPSYAPDAAACGFGGNWDGAHDSYNAMLSAPQMHARHMSAPLGNWPPRGQGWE